MQAARGRERPCLEAMLRQFEYEADLLAADGKAGVDTAWLRATRPAKRPRRLKAWTTGRRS